MQLKHFIKSKRLYCALSDRIRKSYHEQFYNALTLNLKKKKKKKLEAFRFNSLDHIVWKVLIVFPHGRAIYQVCRPELQIVGRRYTSCRYDRGKMHLSCYYQSNHDTHIRHLVLQNAPRDDLVEPNILTS